MISVALKRPVEIRLGIGIHKTSLLRVYIKRQNVTFTPRFPPTFYNKIAPMIGYSDFDLDVGISTA